MEILDIFPLAKVEFFALQCKNVTFDFERHKIYLTDAPMHKLEKKREIERTGKGGEIERVRGGQERKKQNYNKQKEKIETKKKTKNQSK